MQAKNASWFASCASFCIWMCVRTIFSLCARCMHGKRELTVGEKQGWRCQGWSFFCGKFVKHRIDPRSTRTRSNPIIFLPSKKCRYENILFWITRESFFAPVWAAAIHSDDQVVRESNAFCHYSFICAAVIASAIMGESVSKPEAPSSWFVIAATATRWEIKDIPIDFQKKNFDPDKI